MPYLSSPDPASAKLRAELLDEAGIDPEGWGIPRWRVRIAETIRLTARHVTARLPPRVERPTDNADTAKTEAPALEPSGVERQLSRTN